ncbi:MAG: hypothetical protein WBR18_00845 [Anaerolineales bacterium]
MRPSRLRKGRIALLALLLLAACSRSAPASGPSGLLPSQVAETLTAAPTLPPSRTPPPTATPQPTFTDTPTSTALPSSTPTAGPSPSPTGPSLAANDPRAGINLSAPDLTDSFDDRYGWFEYQDPANATITWQRGSLTATDHKPDGFLWWSTSSEAAGDLYAEISAKVGECAGKDAYGTAIRIGGDGYDRGYTMEISCDGYFRMRKFLSGAAPEVMLDWTASESIEPGPNVENRLGFLARGSELAAFSNGQLIGEVEDTFFVYGNFGLFAEAIESPELTATFHDFALWNLRP